MQAAEYTRDSVLKLAEVAFKNPRLIHTETGNIPVAANSNGLYPSLMGVNKTITEEETK